MPRPVAEDLTRLLRQRIETGHWAGGQRLPAERELAAELGVARNTVRRALNQLAEDGLLLRQIGRGTFVAADDSDSLSAIVRRLAGTSPADMMEIRQLLEPSAAASAALNASSSELDAVRIACDNAEAATELAEFEYWDAEFHHRLMTCSRNELLREFHNILRILRNQPLWLTLKRRSFSPRRREHYCQEHREIVDALLHRDPERARRAMLVHLNTVEHNLQGSADQVLPETG